MRSDLLHVVCVITNPIRYKSRYELYRRFVDHVHAAGAKLHVVEAAFGDRPHETLTPHADQHIALRTHDELWLKENLINVGISRLPADWQYVAWVDADVRFARPDWAAETVHQLQHYEVVQMFSVAHDLTPSFDTYQSHLGFVHTMHQGFDRRKVGFNGRAGNVYGSGGATGVSVKGQHASIWHPGYAWAATRKAMDATGGLLDIAILGAADNHMAHGLYGMADLTLGEGPGNGYRTAVLEWQSRAAALHHDVGFVPGALFHDFHGPKRKRGYRDRWKILRENNFDPVKDLTRDWQGLWQLRPERIKLRDDLRRYFRSRDEDDLRTE